MGGPVRGADLEGGHGAVLLTVDLLVAEEEGSLTASTVEVVVGGAVAAATAHCGSWLTTLVTSLGGEEDGG